MRGYYIEDISRLDSIAKCYAAAFGRNSFTVTLGTEYISKNLEWFVVNPKGFLYVIEDESEEIIGFFGSYVKTELGSGSTGAMLMHSSNLRLKILRKRPWLLLNRQLIQKILRILIENPKFFLLKMALKSKPNTWPLKSHLNKEDFSLGLVVIGITPKWRGTGTSTVLMKEFLSQLSKIGLSKAHLSVDSNNSRAIQFYKRFGWKLHSEDKKSSRSLRMILHG